MCYKQRSFHQEGEEGCLYIVPTPIGNLKDITFRAIEILKEVDYIAAEDTRQTKKLLNAFEIQTKLTSYHEHNKKQKGEVILKDLLAGKQIAIVSDAGMPGISDPGEELVYMATSQQVKVIALPGANAALTGLVASGLPSKQFLFFGFLDRHKKKREEALKHLSEASETLIFYEAPHRIQDTLLSLRHMLGNRKAVIARELTKQYEEYLRGSLEDLIAWISQEAIKGEVCLIIEGADIGRDELSRIKTLAHAWWTGLTVQQHVEAYIEKGMTSKEAIKQTATDRNCPKRDVYQDFHHLSKE